MTDPCAQPCRTCKWWDHDCGIPNPNGMPTGRCGWGAAWLRGDRNMRIDSTNCPVWEPKAMPHG